MLPDWPWWFWCQVIAFVWVWTAVAVREVRIWRMKRRIRGK